MTFLGAFLFGFAPAAPAPPVVPGVTFLGCANPWVGSVEVVGL